MNKNHNSYPQIIQFETHNGIGLTNDAKAWLQRIRKEVKMTRLEENVLQIEYPTDLVAQVRVVNVDDCIFRLDLIDPGDKFGMFHCVFPDVPWNNRLFMFNRWPKGTRTDKPGVVILTYPKEGIHPGDTLEVFPGNSHNKNKSKMYP